MPFAFLVPAFLIGLAALAVPLLLHLRHRERKKPRPFPSLMFLARIPIRTDRQRRITDWPLLLLRAAALALLVAAFARPFLRDPTLVVDEDAGLTVLLLDRSASMSATGVREVWADSARAVIDRLPSGRRVAVVAFDAGATILVQPSVDRAAAVAAIAAAPAPGGGTRFGAGLRAASQLLAAEQVAGEIVLISDMQRSGLAATSAPALPAGTTLRAVSLTPDVRDNSAVTAVDLEQLPASEGRRAVVAARLARHGGEGPRTLTANLEVDGRSASQRSVTLEADGVARITFDTVALARSEVRLVVRISEDALPLDDAYHAIVPADATTRVLLVTTADARPDEYRFVEQALAIGRDPTFTVERVTRLDRAAITRSAAILMIDVPPPSGDVGEALSEWVTNGGGLLVAPGERLATRRAGLDLVPASVRGNRQRENGASLGDAETSHPALAVFQGSAIDGFASVRIRRHNVIEPSAAGTVLLRYDDGAPALVAGALGAGHLMLVGIPLDGRRGDFPLQPAFLPFVRGVVGWAAGATGDPMALSSGEPWLAPATVRSPVVRGPGGDLTRPGDGSRFVSLRESGVHEVFDGGTGGLPAALLAVNAPASESDLNPMPADELLLGVGEVPVAAAVTTPEASVASERRQQGWRWVLMALLVILIVEVVVASRGWRGVAATSPVVLDREGSTA
jgi:Mg-chelatase subunit ChlD